MPLPGASFVTQSITLKLVVIIILTGMLIVPIGMVWALVAERAARRDDVVREVGAVWGSRQTVGGIALSVPFETVADVNGVAVRTTRHVVVLPQTLNVDATMAPEVRRRSIFAVNLYRTTLRITGTFVAPDFAKLGVMPDVVQRQQSVIDVGVSDLRGAVSVTPVSWAGASIALEPSAGDGPFGGGLRAVAPMPSSGDVAFSLEMVIAGSERLMFLPSGADTHVTLQSSWNSPGFTGGLLPLTHEIRPDGFRAEWRSNYLSRPFPQTWLSGTVERGALETKTESAAFGVNLVTTVDHYQQTERAVKYGVLFIVLTFAVFFVWEVVESLRVHPVQYLLVGLALVVFYLLLLSLSEQIRFAGAYAVASAATVLLVSAYAARILGAGRRGIAVGGWVSVLYAVLFVLLSLEDLALLVGSVVVFFALAAVMYLTRGVDWYGVRGDGRT